LPPYVFGFDFRKEIMESQSGFVQQIQKSSIAADIIMYFHSDYLELVIAESILATYRHLAHSLLQPGSVKCNYG
jgi:hypothetical protein